MDKKKIIIAGSIIAAIVAIYFGYQWYQKNKKNKYVAPVIRPIQAGQGYYVNQNAPVADTVVASTK